ncbi:MAG TPA: gamma-glutamyltransferase family protein [Candidatus Limnocylindrales bacterium]
MTSRPLVPAAIARGTNGAVVAPHHLATAAGLGVLRSGGNAIDAAIATNAVLAVVMPNGCGIGGDAFWLIWSEADGRVAGLNGSGRSGATASAGELRASGLDRLPRRGPRTITVPGAVRSWADAHARFGRLPPDALLAPAIELAEGGFAAWDGFVEAVERTQAFLPDAGVDDGFERVFRPNGRAWRRGERVRFPALAATLRRLATRGLGDFYEGELAERQARALAAAGSAIGTDDLRAHASTWTDPIGIDYRGVADLTHAPNSSGIVGLEILALLGRFDPPSPAAFGPDGPADPHWAHLGIEASKLAMADRDRWLCDPDHAGVPVARLLDEAYAADLASRIDHRRAAPAPAAAVPRGGGTIYLAVVDGEGNAVSLIESNYSGFGSLVVDPETGIHYQNRGSYFSLDPGSPNVLAPRKRPLHTLMPAMLLRDGRPWVVTGSMGGDAQPQVHAQVVSALVDGGVDVATAVGAPRWFVEPADHFEPPVEVRAEPRFASGILDALRSLGHPVTELAAFDSTVGHAHAIELVDGGPAAGGSLAAATDPRSNGLPAAW